MLKHIRLATKEEVEALRKTSNYTAATTVFAMDQNEGDPDFAVVKSVIEVDPVYYGKRTSDKQKVSFIYLLEERLMGLGITQYFFNVDEADEKYRAAVIGWGAEEVSKTPERRYQKVLTVFPNEHKDSNTDN